MAGSATTCQHRGPIVRRWMPVCPVPGLPRGWARATTSLTEDVEQFSPELLPTLSRLTATAEHSSPPFFSQQLRLFLLGNVLVATTIGVAGVINKLEELVIILLAHGTPQSQRPPKPGSAQKPSINGPQTYAPPYHAA